MFFQSKLHNNSILTGSVDSYCLVCDNYLRSEDEAYTHTEKPIHKKNMGAALHVEKYKNDQIIKVKKGYYCSYCNILLSTTTKVGIHVSDTKHQKNKGAQMLNRVGDNIIAFDEVAISPEAWHGIMENTCVICNVEFDESDIHRTDQCHILKLIQSKCEFGDKYVYRKVDEDSFYCLICGNVFSVEHKPDHHEDIEHKTLYNSGKELKNKTPPSPVLTKKTRQIPLKPKTVNSTKNNVLDITESPAAEGTKMSNAASAKKKEAPTKSTDTGHNKENVIAAETAKPVGAKKANATDNSKLVEAKKTEPVEANTIKPNAKTTPNNETANNIPKAEDCIENASKLMDINRDPKMRAYLSKNHYIILEENNFRRCVVCDLTHIKPEDVEDHISNDHHQMMLKKYTETSLKKVNGPPARINETSPVDDLVKTGGKSHLKKSDKPDNNATELKGKPKEKVTASHQQPALKLDPPLDAQSKQRQQNSDTDISSEEDDRSKILDNIDKYQRNNINIDFGLENARCKRCNQYVTFNFACLEKHIQDHIKEKDNRLKNREKDSKAEVETFARDNGMVVLNNKVNCTLCTLGLALNLKDLVAHVNSSSHKDKVLNMNVTDPVKKVKASIFIQLLLRVDSNLGSDVILNNSYVLKYHSLHCIMPDGDNFTCGLCDVDFSKENRDQLPQHLNSCEHKQNMGFCNVVSSLSEEFLREIKPGMYHCGYCNDAFPWPAMQEHLTSPTHVSTRRHARWNLERCHAIIRNARPQQVSSLQAVNFA